MSVHRVLGTHVGPYIHLNTPYETSWTAVQVADRFRGCGGHLPFYQVRDLGYAEGYVFTFLRDPLQRTVSQYLFTQIPVFAGTADFAAIKGLSLLDVLRRHQKQGSSFANTQTLFLSGLPAESATIEEHFASALENLAHFDFIGFTESLDADLNQLLSTWGVSVPVAVPRENSQGAGPAALKFSNDDLEEIRHHLRFDLQLYEAAKQARPKKQLRQHRWSPSRPPRQDICVEVTGVHVHSVVALSTGPEGILPGGPMIIRILIESDQPYADVAVGYTITDAMGQLLAGCNSALCAIPITNIPWGVSVIEFRMVNHLGWGFYAVSVRIHRLPGSEEQPALLCRLEPAAFLEVGPPHAPYREGVVDMIPTVTLGARDGVAPEQDAGAVMGDCAGLAFPPDFAPIPTLGAMWFPVEIRNHGSSVLSSATLGECGVFVAYHWLAEDGAGDVWDGSRTPLPRSVPEGERCTAMVRVEHPPREGNWRLQIRLVREGVHWFECPSLAPEVPPSLRFRLWASEMDWVGYS